MRPAITFFNIQLSNSRKSFDLACCNMWLDLKISVFYVIMYTSILQNWGNIFCKTNRVHDWKDNWADSKTLLVKGCRQVGKTTSVRHFAAENYKYVIYVDVRSETNLSLLESASESNVVEIGLPQSHWL